MAGAGAWTSLLGPDKILTVRDHPPLLYFLTRASIDIIGLKEFAIRLPSAITSIMAIPLIIAFGRAIKYPLAGVLTAFMLSLSPFFIRQSSHSRQNR